MPTTSDIEFGKSDDEEEEVAECYICRSPNNLIKPCECNLPVHLNCLFKYMTTSTPI